MNQFPSLESLQLGEILTVFKVKDYTDLMDNSMYMDLYSFIYYMDFRGIE